MSIGYNPSSTSKRKSIEPWLLHTFDEDFYDETLSVLVVTDNRASVISPPWTISSRGLKKTRACEEAFDLGLVDGIDEWKDWFVL